MARLIERLLTLVGFQASIRNQTADQAEPRQFVPPVIPPPPNFKTMTSNELMDYCDAYWQQLEDEESGMTIESSERIQSNYAQIASNELASRGPESLPWAIERLSHSDYFARETAAGLIDSLGKRQLLGEYRDETIGALSELATREWEDDTKEIQANDAAVWALGTIGDQKCIPALHVILNSAEWKKDDLSWSAAEALSKIVGQSFMESDSPEDAARDWLNQNWSG